MKPFLKIKPVSKNGKDNDIKSSLGYVSREDENVRNREDLHSFFAYNIPEYIKEVERNKTEIKTKEEFSQALTFFEEYENCSRENKRLALNLTFDLPFKQEEFNVTLETEKYVEMLNDIIEKINNEYYIVDYFGKEKIVNKEEVLNFKEYKKLKIPICYAIHKVQKEENKIHPHCHLLISTVGFSEDIISKTNFLNSIQLFDNSINNELLSKFDFYYKINDFVAESVNKILKKYNPNYKEKELYNFTKKDLEQIENVITEDRTYFNLSGLSNVENKEIEDSEILKKINIDENNKKNKKIEKFIRFLKIAFSDDNFLIKIIEKRNNLVEKIKNFIKRKFLKVTSEVTYNVNTNKEMDFKGFKILKEKEKGIMTSEIVKPVFKVFDNEKGIMKEYYNYGSLDKIVEESDLQMQNFENTNSNVENINNMLFKLNNEYLEAVKKYNELRKKEINKKDIINGRGSVFKKKFLDVLEDKDKINIEMSKIINKIVDYDLIINSSLENRTQNNLIKKYLETGELGTEILELNLKKFLEENSNIKYRFNGIENNFSLKELRERARNIDEKIEKLKNERAESNDIEEQSNIYKEIDNLQKEINKINSAYRYFNEYQKPKIMLEFETLKGRNRSIYSIEKTETILKILDKYKNTEDILNLAQRTLKDKNISKDKEKIAKTVRRKIRDFKVY